MKKSGYHTTFHIYLIFLLSLLGAIAVAAGLFFMSITIQKPDGTGVRSDWPKEVATQLEEGLTFDQGEPLLREELVNFLQDNEIGLQILDESGHQIFEYRKPEGTSSFYSAAEVLQFSQSGRVDREGVTVSTLSGTVSHGDREYVYLLYFPLNVRQVTMYLSGERFDGGKQILLAVVAALVLLILAAGGVYGFWITRQMDKIGTSVREIAERSYQTSPVQGVFGALYDCLNALNEEIRQGDRLQEHTDTMRREWIANITHDLKTPLSPIKGYAEMLEEGGVHEGESQRYGGIMRKNADYMEALIEDLMLTYQLESHVVSVHYREDDLVRFLRELAIHILNTPEYENRTIHFESDVESFLYSFDRTLLERALRNLIVNAFVHGEEDTEVWLRISGSDGRPQIEVEDNGRGMTQKETERIFDRYYRGTDTGQKPEGTGLGLAIVEGIVKLHGGKITVESLPGAWTVFHISLHKN